jgi:hypothetical protein
MVLCALLLLSGCGQPAVGGSTPAEANGAANGAPAAPADRNHRLEIEGLVVFVARPTGDVDATERGELSILARRPQRLLVLETLASRPQSLGRCGAGEEKWIELIDLDHGVSLFSRRVESCLQGIIPGDPVAEWPEGSQCISINLVSDTAQKVSQDGDECRE